MSENDGKSGPLLKEAEMLIALAYLNRDLITILGQYMDTEVYERRLSDTVRGMVEL